MTFRLEAEGGGTRLFLVHDGFEPGSEALIGMGHGWPGLLARVVVAIP
ncbi:SRPBCC domain-containing protein [Actinoplanes sp. NPDC026619]